MKERRETGGGDWTPNIEIRDRVAGPAISEERARQYEIFPAHSVLS